MTDGSAASAAPSAWKRTAERPAGQRVVFLDALRLVAAVQMIQGHTLGALADPAGLVGPLASLWTFARGLTSVAFLFAAGLSVHLVALRPGGHVGSAHDGGPGTPVHRGPSPRGSRRRVRRALFLLALGYALHLPIGTPLAQFFVVDVLQTIGVSLLVVEGVAAALGRSVRAHVACAALGAACLALAPSLATIRAEGPFLPLLAYVTRSGGSLFPLTPFAGFVFLGAAAGAFVLPDGTSTPRARSVLGLLVVGGGAIGLSRVVAPLTPGAAAQESPSHALLKLGVVALVAAGIAAALVRVARLPRALEVLAGETLTLYVAHLLVLYPSYVGLAHHVGSTLDVPVALAVAVALFAFSAGVAFLMPVARAAVRRRCRPRALTRDPGRHIFSSE
jgi:hypothetical protein